MLMCIFVFVFHAIAAKSGGPCNDFTIGKCNVNEDGLILEDDLVIEM